MKAFLLIMALIFSSPASAAWTFPDKSADVTADQTALSTRWNAILVEGKTYASMTLNGLGTLPTLSFSVFDKTSVIDLSQFNGQVQIIGFVVVLCGVLLSIFIIFA